MLARWRTLEDAIWLANENPAFKHELKKLSRKTYFTETWSWKVWLATSRSWKLFEFCFWSTWNCSIGTSRSSKILPSQDFLTFRSYQLHDLSNYTYTSFSYVYFSRRKNFEKNLFLYFRVCLFSTFFLRSFMDYPFLVL